jgi:hypothetical protein
MMMNMNLKIANIYIVKKLIMAFFSFISLIHFCFNMLLEIRHKFNHKYTQQKEN